VTAASPRPASGARPKPEAGSRAALPRAIQTLAGALAFLLGASVLAAAFDSDLSPRTQSLLFWSGLALSLTATMTVGLRRGARASERMAALAGFGALLYLPYVLRSPEHAIFGEDLYQGRSARMLAETGHSPSQFPGLDFVTIWLHDTTGVGLDSLARVIPLAVHTTVPLLVFGIATAIGLSGRTSFLVALIYLANPAFFFLHSAFSPATLGILFFLAAWGVVAACARDHRSSSVFVPAIVACLAGTVVTDHLSALMTAVGFVVLALVVAVMRRRAVADAFMLAVASIVLLSGWLVLHETKASEYVSAALTARIGALVDTLRQEGEARGDLFGTQTVPLPERLVGYAYPAFVVLLCVVGVFVYLWRQRSLARTPGPLFVALLILGPGLWTVTAPAVVGGASELAYRAWPFFFLGIALCAGLGVRALDGLRGVRWPAVLGAVAVVMAGGIVVGDNVGGRYPRSAPRTAAGPESVTDASIAAASWLGQTAGRGHPFVGDRGSELVFGTFGEQQPLTKGVALPFVAATPAQISQQLAHLGASYVVVDRRISLLPPRLGYYFGPDELATSNPSRYDQPFPVGQLRKLDSVKTLSLIYDNGVTAIYGPVALAVEPPGGP
jgi:hypothetical protein